MEKTCSKCGAVAEVEDGLAAECPKCGVVYAKAEAQANLDRVRAQRAAMLAKQARNVPLPYEDEPRPVPKRSSIETIAWALAGVGATYGAVEFVWLMSQPLSAPQQGAAAAMSAAWAIIPYCLARSIQQFRKG